VKDKKYKSGFKVPENYFDNFEKRLFNTIESETLPKETGFKAPDGYFDNLEDTLLQKLNATEKPQKVISLNSRRTWVYLTAIAACLTIIISMLIKDESIVKQIDSIKTVTIENYIDEGYLELESYEVLALLDDDDLADLNFESDIFSEESLENYLLENSIEETLLIE
tara:strand:+ start:1559 stop:2059 length:501 start_codon:yes stop_codon:yes gene_type:complete